MSVRAIFADKQILFDYTDNYSDLCHVKTKRYEKEIFIWLGRLWNGMLFLM